MPEAPPSSGQKLPKASLLSPNAGFRSDSFATMDKRISSNHAYMVPDRGFRKQLHTLDPELEVVWEWGVGKWQIWRMPKDGADPCHVLTVETKDKSYRELGTDILLKLKHGSYLANMTTNQLVNYFDELDNQVMRRKQNDMYNLIHSITLDTLDWQRGVIKIQIPRNYKVRRAILDA